ncbi:hypothetical protein PPERSA_07303 [Pseudocohnilembus persalinus]|uniref:Uncharacterized protein n=1 Tax=Pseudocohnilembus persalinus TaxID=266149 RepID=A0A0V0Q7B2_PSEPJ|nr:hypothetical protein PPERSA_07303 [Pseudocohnilembus persalinus]|eukprot:KRW98078.1 hypothetical protein PPERSA_07303 [Pseudocohnilembus persalinus]
MSEHKKNINKQAQGDPNTNNNQGNNINYRQSFKNQILNHHIYKDFKRQLLNKVFSKKFIRFRKIYILGTIFPFMVFSYTIQGPKIMEIRDKLYHKKMNNKIIGMTNERPDITPEEYDIISRYNQGNYSK